MKLPSISLSYLASRGCALLVYCFMISVAFSFIMLECPVPTVAWAQHDTPLSKTGGQITQLAYMGNGEALNSSAKLNVGVDGRFSVNSSIVKTYDKAPVDLAVAVYESDAYMEYRLSTDSEWTDQLPCLVNAGNYEVLMRCVSQKAGTSTAVSVNVCIMPRIASIQVFDAVKHIGQNDPVIMGSVEGVLEGDTLGDVIFYRSNTQYEDAGEYPNALSAIVANRNPNYTYTLKKATFTILDAGVIVTQNTNRGGKIDASSASVQGDGGYRIDDDTIPMTSLKSESASAELRLLPTLTIPVSFSLVAVGIALSIFTTILLGLSYRRSDARN